MRNALLLAIGCLCIGTMHAQSTFGTILGSVKDPAGSVIVRVKVTVMNEGTGISKATLTDENGNYEVTHLNPGVYSLSAEAPGFQRWLNQHVNLETGQLLRSDAQMQVGQ